MKHVFLGVRETQNASMMTKSKGEYLEKPIQKISRQDVLETLLF